MRSLSAIIAAVLSIAGLSIAETTLRAYFIGNSLTMSTTLNRVHELFAQRDIDLQYGSQLSGGKSLIRHLHYEEEPSQKWLCWETSVPSGDSYNPHPNFYTVDPATWRFGRFDTALVEHEWDVLVLQLYGSNLHDDMIAIPAFIDLALQHNPSVQVYIYSTWPRRLKAKGPDNKRTGPIENIDYQDLWLHDYEATIDDTDWKAGWNYASRDFVDTLMNLLRDRYANIEKPIRLIPTGEVIYELDKNIKAGQLPGLAQLAERKPDMLPGLDDDTTLADGVNALYADAIHFNPMPHQSDSVGIFISGSMLFTCISGRNPVGMSGAVYGFDDAKDAELVRALQQTMWDVVTADPRTGIK